MATKLKHSKATKRTATKSATVTPIRKYSDLPDGHPALKRLAEAADDYMAASSIKPTRAKPKRLTLTEEQARTLENQASDLGMMLAAVSRLSWMLDSTDRTESFAGAQALEAISELGSIKADALMAALGGGINGNYAEEFAVYAKALGYVHKGAAK